MKRRAAVLALLVVGAGLVGVVPASAFAETAVAQNTADSRDTATHSPGSVMESSESADRAPPKLPEEWRQTYGTSGDDTFADLVRTPDGGYLLVGSTGENTDGWIVKVDGEGEKQWSKTLGGEGTDRFWGVAKTDSGYLVAGRTNDDSGTPQGWLVEVGPEGEIRNERTAGAGAFYAIERSNASGSSQFLAAGWTYGDGKDGWLLGVDATGSEEWQATVSPPEEYGEGYLRAIVPTDSGYYLAGKAVGDSDDGWALKVGPEGTPEWQTGVGGASRDDVWAAAPAVGESGTDDGFVFAGETESNSDGPRDGWLVKLGPDGEVEWEQKPGGAGTQWLDSAMATDEGYLFTGSSDQGPQGSADGWVIATDAAGDTRWESYYGTSGWDKPWPAIRAHGEGYLLAGQTTGGDAGGKDGWLVRIGASEGSATANDTSEETTGGTSDSSADGSETIETTDADSGDQSDTTSEKAIRGETPTATDSPTSVPGFGVGAALLALAALLLAVRR